MKRIEKLPEEIRGQIRSGIVIYDLSRVVEELVYNCLDAGAGKVSIAVGVGTCYVKVVDDGSGVSRDGLDLVGERYATSKYNPLDDMDTSPLNFGYLGEALSSIADVSLVEIVTKAHGRPNGYRKVLKGCKCLYLGIDDDRVDVGTTVTVRDLFYNQPVRRKHMLSNPKKVLHMIKECVIRIALVHPSVSFKVVDIESEDELLHTCPFPNALSLLARSFGIEACNSLEELNVAGGRFKLLGYISGTLNILSLKVFQYAYINSKFVSKGPIHKMINNMASSFIVGSQNEKQNRSQICPAFLLNLQCPKSYYDLTFEPSKTSVEFKDWDSVLTFIGDAIRRLWSRGKSDVLHENCEIGKKRHRALDCIVPEETSPKSKKLIVECNNSLSSRENRSSSDNLHVTIIEKLNTDCTFLCQTDIPEHSSEVSPLPHNMFSPEDTFLDNDLYCLNRSFRQAGNIFSSGWQSASPKIDGEMDRLLADQAQLCNSLDLIDNSEACENVRKPFLQSCFLGRRLKHDEKYLATGDQFEFKIDGNSKQNAYRADGGIVEVKDINNVLSPMNAWHTEQPDGLSFSKTTMQHDDVHEDVRKPFLQSCFVRRRPKHDETILANDDNFDSHSKQNAFRADGKVVEEVNDINKIMSPKNVWHYEQPDVLSFSKATMQHNVIDDVRNPLLQSCFSGRRLEHGETSLATDEKFEFEIDGVSKQNVFGADGMAVEKIDDINKIMSQRDVWCDEQSDVISLSETTIKHDVSENARKPFLRSCNLGRRQNEGEKPLAINEEIEFEIDSQSKQNAYRADGMFVEEIDNIDKIFSQRDRWCNEPNSPLFFTTSRQHDVHQRSIFLGDSVNSTLNPLPSDEDDLFLRDFVKPFPNKGWRYDGNVKYELANKDTKGWRYDLEEISISPGKECFFSSSKNLSSCATDHAGYMEISSEFQEYDLKGPLSSKENSTDLQKYDLNNTLSPNSINVSTDCINSWGEGGLKRSSTSRHHSSINFDWESSIMAHRTNLSKMFVPYRRGRRSRSAPPFYRCRKKFSALSDSLTTTTRKINLQTIHDGTGMPETCNRKQIQSHSEMNSVKPSIQSNQYHHSTTLYCEGNSISDNIPDARMKNIDKGQCSNKCYTGSFEGGAIVHGCEEFIPREIQETVGCREEQQNSHPHHSSTSESLHLKNQDAILDIASGILLLASDSLVPRSLDKNFLEGAKVLQQVDKKFIPIVAGRTLALIDQHAADERIRLEELRRKVLSGEMRTTNYLECEQELVIPEIGIQLLHDYAEQIQNWGWICNIHTQGSRSFTRNLNIMNKQQAVAKLLAIPCVLGVNLSDVDLLEFLQQLSDTDGSSTVPPSVLRVLNNKACRGAIMFGDTLLPSECSLIVDELKQTSLCFQCAHGRPTTVPLVDLDALSEQIAKMTSWTSGSCESWHGLRRHKISLERTAKRLNG
ncbi:unnamed protein product [Cuscuta campestris]|uniref:MutL C-terminal dimerisation domain-containing protein n=1 Tax=Cuscuta campestris TaxID=132261 RepID=A0A484L1G3_9ASTE|nr:unnamed protein product [Cuscuta campestris]